MVSTLLLRQANSERWGFACGAENRTHGFVYLNMGSTTEFFLQPFIKNKFLFGDKISFKGLKFMILLPQPPKQLELQACLQLTVTVYFEKRLGSFFLMLLACYHISY